MPVVTIEQITAIRAPNEQCFDLAPRGGASGWERALRAKHFGEWHDHYFLFLSRDETGMTDVFCFSAPLPVVGAAPATGVPACPQEMLAQLLAVPQQ